MDDQKSAWTVGHSTHSTGEFINILKSCDATLLLDIRTVPRSRKNPHFNKDVLPESLAEHGIKYRHERALGGLRKPQKDSINTGWHNNSFRGFADYMQREEFADKVGEVVEEAARERLVLMCAEAVPWRCHRSLISDALSVRGLQVRHLMGKGKEQPHRRTPFLRVDGLKLTYPEVQQADMKPGNGEQSQSAEVPHLQHRERASAAHNSPRRGGTEARSHQLTLEAAFQHERGSHKKLESKAKQNGLNG